MKKMRRRASRKRNPSNATVAYPRKWASATVHDDFNDRARLFWRRMTQKYGHTDTKPMHLNEREKEEYREFTGRSRVPSEVWELPLYEAPKKRRKRNPDNEAPKRTAKKSSRAVSKGCESTRRARWREAVKKAGPPVAPTLAARRAALAKAHALYKAPKCKARGRRGKKRARR